MTSVVAAVKGFLNDANARLAAIGGALLEGGNLTGPWNSGDNGQSWGPWQINSPSHPGVTYAQANDPAQAIKIIGPSYAAAAKQQDWTNPQQAFWATIVQAENPDRSQGYAAAGPDSDVVRNAFVSAQTALGQGPTMATDKAAQSGNSGYDQCVRDAFARFPPNQGPIVDAARTNAIKECIGTEVNTGLPVIDGIPGALGSLLGTQQFVRLLVIAGGAALVLIGLAAVVLKTEASAV
jgi:hypothetical protein